MNGIRLYVDVDESNPNTDDNLKEVSLKAFAELVKDNSWRYIRSEERVIINMISDTDHFALLKTIKGIKDNVDKMYTLGNDELQYVRDEFLGYLRQLMDVVNTLHSEE